jgi:c-di-GMP-binding flagellar brake protein YcgR
MKERETFKGWAHEERRRFPRAAVRVPAVYRSANFTVDGHVCNISRGGAGLSFPQLDPAGEAGEIQLTLPGQTEVLLLRGRIVWSKRSREEGGADMGLCFDELDRDQRVALANFLIARFSSS